MGCSLLPIKNVGVKYLTTQPSVSNHSDAAKAHEEEDGAPAKHAQPHAQATDTDSPKLSCTAQAAAPQEPTQAKTAWWVR